MKITPAELQVLVHALSDYKHYLLPSASVLAEPEDNVSRLYLYNLTCELLDRAIDEVSK